MNIIQSSKIGIIAGEGMLPAYAAQSIKKYNNEVIIVSLNKDNIVHLQQYADHIVHIPFPRLATIFNYLHSHNVTHLLVLGKLHKLKLIQEIPLLDALGRHYLAQMINWEDNTFHDVVAKGMMEQGFQLVSQKMFLSNYFLPAGIYSKRIPDQLLEDNLKFGIEIAKKASKLEVSQTTIIKNKSVMAFEAAEGTDQTIIRGCKYAQKDAIIIKVPWGKQSDTFDLPTIGARTMSIIAKYKGNCLAVQANTCFVLELEKCQEIADKNNICFIAFDA